MSEYADEMKRIESAFQILEKLGILEKECPACGITRWEKAGCFVSPVVLHPDCDAAVSYPMAAIACSNCGYVRTFLEAYLFNKK